MIDRTNGHCEKCLDQNHILRSPDIVKRKERKKERKIYFFLYKIRIENRKVKK
jgi:hypothetical protein